MAARIEYFISYLYTTEKGGLKFGNCTSITSDKITTGEKIREIESEFRSDLGAKEVIILNFQKLGEVEG